MPKKDSEAATSGPICSVAHVRSLSMRDPGGRLFDVDGRLVRAIFGTSARQLDTALSTRAVTRLIERGQFINSVCLPANEAHELIERWTDEGRVARFSVEKVVEHPRVPFVSYPHEWPPQMLYKAGMLTLELAQELLREGCGLKDATPLNVLFVGPKPIFVDVLSIEPRSPGDPIWLPFGQFARTFVNPLVLSRLFGVSLKEIFLTGRDGVTAEDVYSRCSFLQRLWPSLFPLVTLPVLLGRHRQRVPKRRGFQRQADVSPERAQTILEFSFRQLKKALSANMPRRTKYSHWRSYMTDTLPYSTEQLSLKKTFLEVALQRQRPKQVLDIGCNTGFFSRVAAQSGARVVAIDSDVGSTEATWQLAQSESLDILPLVVDFANPTPSCGWLNLESQSFLDRAYGSFDMVLMLAVLHHVVVGAGIPFNEILKLLSRITTKSIVLEFIGPEDEMFQSLARGRDYSYFTSDFFERSCEEHFRISRSEWLPNKQRCLFLLEKP